MVKGGKNTVDEFDTLIKEGIIEQDKSTELTQDKKGIFLAVAAGVSLIPAYVFHGVFDLLLTRNAILYLLVIGASAYALSLSYYNLFVATYKKFAKLNEQRFEGAKNVKDRKAFVAQKQALNSKSATAHSIFFANLVYLILFFIMAFYVLQNANTIINYLLSGVVPAGAIYWLSTQEGKTKEGKYKY